MIGESFGIGSLDKFVVIDDAAAGQELGVEQGKAEGGGCEEYEDELFDGCAVFGGSGLE